MGRGPRKRKAAADAAAAGAPGPAAEEEDADPVSEEAMPGKRRKVLKKRKAQDEAEEGPLDAAEAGKRLAQWTDDSKKQERWLASRGGGLEGYLAETPGQMVPLRDFLPLEMADCVLAILESLPEETWELSEQAGDEAAANHRFWSADVCDVPDLAPLRGLFWSLLPKLRGEPTLPIISCGRYGKSDFIGRHDDRAHVPFNGAENIFSRTVAAIWYLTRDWAASEGGCLLDLKESDNGMPEVRHVPKYNSLMVFEVPHWHAVTGVTSERYRYSIFGWWHQQGKRYELPGAPISASAATKGPGAKKKRKVVRKVRKAGAAQEEDAE